LRSCLSDGDHLSSIAFRPRLGISFFDSPAAEHFRLAQRRWLPEQLNSNADAMREKLVRIVPWRAMAGSQRNDPVLLCRSYTVFAAIERTQRI
jgi:hypothetical protein